MRSLPFSHQDMFELFFQPLDSRRICRCSLCGLTVQSAGKMGDSGPQVSSSILTPTGIQNILRTTELSKGRFGFYLGRIHAIGSSVSSPGVPWNITALLPRTSSVEGGNVRCPRHPRVTRIAWVVSLFNLRSVVQLPRRGSVSFPPPMK